MDTPANEPSFKIEYKPYGRSGGVNITIRLPGGEPFTDRVAITDAGKRSAFIESLLDRMPGLDPALLKTEMERIAAEVMTAAPEPGGSGGDESSHATMLVAMAEADEGVELFHGPGSSDATAYATIPVNGHCETWPLKSQAFRQWLSRLFYTTQDVVPGGQAVADAVNTLVGKALFEGEERQVHVRVAEHDGDLWLDLADAEGRAVRITKSGWEVRDGDIPVKFLRRQGMLPLPVPERGGRIEDFRALVNLPGEEEWILTIAWLVATFRPGRPFPLLNTTGEQGCAKSTLTKMLRSLIDPAKPLLRRPPKGDRDLMIACTNSWVVSYDNISSISNDLSDSLCSLSTGGGFATRALYTDDDEKIFDAMRPVIVNGITDAVTRPDLLDRSINVRLGVIPWDRRRDEDELWDEFYRVRPRLLGALLTIVSTALRNLKTTRLAVKPRMADFAQWITAAEPALPWAPGQFMTAYQANREASDLLAVEASPIGPTVLAMMSTVSRWEGTATNLLESLTQRADEATKSRNDWPAAPRRCGGELRRIAPNLRALGVGVEFADKPQGHDKRMLIWLHRSAQTPSAPPAPPAEFPRYLDGWRPSAGGGTDAWAQPWRGPAREPDSPADAGGAEGAGDERTGCSDDDDGETELPV
jgi:hypothetical protein